MREIKAEDGTLWLVGSEREADKAAKEYILDSLWAFKTSFIASVANLSNAEERAIEKMQRDMSEDANPIIRRIIGESKLNHFVKMAIDADGRGHFLSPWNGEEVDSDDIPGLPKGKLAYRLD